MTGSPRVFSIDAGAPFLPTLVDGILDGTLVPGRVYRDDPLALANLTVFLPTRRAARALADTLVERLDRNAAVLPRIRPLGEVDDDGSDGWDGDGPSDPTELDLPPAMAEPDRLVALAGLVLDWKARISPASLVTPSGHSITVPASAADALHLARDLLALIDQAAIDGIDWSDLERLVPDDYAGWWQLTLGFLRIAIEAWPEYLRQVGRIDPAARRVAVLRAVSRRIAERGGANNPMIAAGSTGSQPATAELLAAVAHLPAGAVVLPGLDFDIDGPTFENLASSKGEDGAASHPQAALARLLGVIGIDRASVRHLGDPGPTARSRARIVSHTMLPAGRTDRWPGFSQTLAADPAGTTAALAGIAVVSAVNEAEEALAVATALREALETPGATAALVTPDRGLARRVCTELARFGVSAEDSAGVPLGRTAPGALALLLADSVAGGLDPVSLVALTRHPLARFGMAADEIRTAARALELTCLRGPRLAPGGDALVAATREQAVAGRRFGRVHPSVRRLDDRAQAGARLLAERIRDAVAPLEALDRTGEADHRAIIEAHLAALRTIAADEAGSDARLFDGAAGVALARFYAGHLDAEAPPLPVRVADLSAVLRALMQGETVRQPSRAARVSIWGQLEARMMTVDRLVVGGLNEGAWPAATDTGPWLSRPMRGRLGFPPPEQRIGLSAHDFVQALGTHDVVLTRSGRSGGTPTVPTRFLTRLTGLVGAAEAGRMAAHGERFLDWARRLDDRPFEPRVRRPCPKPPLSARPRELSVTDIERWIRDPYAIYARRILKLEPLADLGERPDFGTRGSVLHAALARFTEEWDGPHDDAAIARLVEIGREEFAAIEPWPEIHALWWPRFVAAAAWLVRSFEAERGDVRRFAERSGRWEVAPGPDGFALKGRADRIDLLDDGRLSIVDFKSGSAPSDKQIAAGESPQLALEAAIARRGGFEAVPAGEAAELVHVVLKGVEGRDKVCVYEGLGERNGSIAKSVGETVRDTEEALVRLVAAYADPDRGYLSRAHPFKTTDSSPYDHLARVREWSIAPDDEGDAD